MRINQGLVACLLVLGSCGSATVVHVPRVRDTITEKDLEAAVDRLLKAAVTVPSNPAIDGMIVTRARVSMSETELGLVEYGLLDSRTENQTKFKHADIADFRIIRSWPLSQLELMDGQGRVLIVIKAGKENTSRLTALADFYCSVCPTLRDKYR